jgi:uncharacterized protein YlbG (UPF0298 family)
MSEKTMNKKKAKFKKVPKITKITDEVIADLETQFQSIRSVYDAHVDLDEQGEVYAIGVFSDGMRTPKRIMREVEEIFRNVMGYRVNYKKIGIVERKEEIPEIRKNRVKFISAYTVQQDHDMLEGTINLEFGQVPIEEKVQIHPFEMELEYFIAHVTAKALEKMIQAHIRIHCVKEINMGDIDVICVTMSTANQEDGSIEMYVGTVVKSKDLISGVAKATLDAMNRRLAAVN